MGGSDMDRWLDCDWRCDRSSDLSSPSFEYWRSVGFRCMCRCLLLFVHSRRMGTTGGPSFGIYPDSRGCCKLSVISGAAKAKDCNDAIGAKHLTADCSSALARTRSLRQVD